MGTNTPEGQVIYAHVLVIVRANHQQLMKARKRRNFKTLLCLVVTVEGYNYNTQIGK